MTIMKTTPSPMVTPNNVYSFPPKYSDLFRGFGVDPFQYPSHLLGFGREEKEYYPQFPEYKPHGEGIRKGFIFPPAGVQQLDGFGDVPYPEYSTLSGFGDVPYPEYSPLQGFGYIPYHISRFPAFQGFGQVDATDGIITAIESGSFVLNFPTWMLMGGGGLIAYHLIGKKRHAKSRRRKRR